MSSIGKQFPSLPWHMWKPRPAEHIIQPAPGLGSQRIRGCYAIHRQAAESGRQPPSGAFWWTLIDLSSLPSFGAHPTSPVLRILGRISVMPPTTVQNFTLKISSTSFVVSCMRPLLHFHRLEINNYFWEPVGMGKFKRLQMNFKP